jgi:TRAP-type C4-dicarboxylate transport system permease small subunit
MAEMTTPPLSEPTDGPPRTWLDKLCNGVAVAGGILCLIVALTSVISVVGRITVTNFPAFGRTWLGGIVKDIILANTEFVKMAIAVAIFSFLPFAQIRRGNIVVDTFTTWLPKRAIEILDAFWDIVYALVMGAIAYALIFGTQSSMQSGETTQQLNVKLWPSIAISTAFCWLLALVCIATAARLLRRKVMGAQS